jgi:DNA-binding winged helix-turn-helix (wHTH) protein/predicted ATPase
MREINRWHFGPIDLDASERRLLRDGQVVPVAGKALGVLVALLRRAGQLVTKDELFRTVWPGVVVTDAALSRAVHELRVALDDRAATPRYVQTVHGVGFRFIAPFAMAPGAGGATHAGQWLIGREADLARLQDALAAAHAGHRQLVFITGEAGIGKTAVVQTFVEGQSGTDLWLAQGRCIEQYGPGEAHLPILEALEQLARQAGPAEFVEVFSRYAPNWLAQLPWLAGEAGSALRRPSEATPQRMLRELAHALDTLAQHKTVVLWLEDLHWSDPSSLEVVSYIAGRRDAARLLLIASYRTADASGPASAALHSLALRLTQCGQAVEMPLPRLRAADVGRYLTLRFGSLSTLPIDALAAFILHRTEGNALFAVSMVDDLVRRGELVENGGRWHLPGGLTGIDDRLPDTLRRLVHDEIERLTDVDRRLVEAAAVVGPGFCSAAAAAALNGDASDIEDRCMQLALQGRLVEQQPAVRWPDGSVSAGFRFRHALYWQGVNERVPHGRRADWQRRIGLRQEKAFGSQCSAIASELAMRFEVAQDIERSLLYLRTAGAAALSRCAYRECIDLIRHGLQLLSALPPPQRARQELDLLLPLGAALMAFQGYASADVEATYRRAIVLCQTTGQPADLMRALRGQWNVALLRADLAEARRAAGRLLAQAESSGDERMRVDAHTKLGQTCLQQGDLGAARTHLEAALDASTPSSDRMLLQAAPRVAAYLAWALWYGGEATRSMAVGETALELARDADSPHSSVFAFGYVGWLRLMRGDLDGADELATRTRELSKEYGIAYWRQLAEFLGGAVAVRRSRLADGIATMRRAIDEVLASGGRVGVSTLLCLLSEALLTAKRMPEARAALADARARIAATGNGLYAAEALRLEGVLAQAEGDTAEGRVVAERSFREALQTARRQGARALELRAVVSLARLLGQSGDAQRAVDLLAPVREAIDDGFSSEDLACADELLASLGERRAAAQFEARRTVRPGAGPHL